MSVSVVVVGCVVVDVALWVDCALAFTSILRCFLFEAAGTLAIVDFFRFFVAFE